MAYIFHLPCCFCHLKICWLKYEHFSEGSENHLKRHGTERVKTLSLGLRHGSIASDSCPRFLAFPKFSMISHAYLWFLLFLQISLFRGHPHMISDFLGPFLTYLPTHIRFYFSVNSILD